MFCNWYNGFSYAQILFLFLVKVRWNVVSEVLYTLKISRDMQVIFEALVYKMFWKHLVKSLLKFIYSEKATKFCEIFPLHRAQVNWRFCKILWPSQNIWTLYINNFSPLCRLQASLSKQGRRVLSSGPLINVQVLLVMFPFHLQTEDRFN